MRGYRSQAGFTLLEVIVVIFIVAILVSLGVPRMMKLVEYSRVNEAWSNISAIRNSIERCFIVRQTYENCDQFSVLDASNPSAVPDAHFTYTLPGPYTTTDYTVVATRNTLNGGDGSSWVRLEMDSGGITKSGSGVFSGVQ